MKVQYIVISLFVFVFFISCSSKSISKNYFHGITPRVVCQNDYIRCNQVYCSPNGNEKIAFDTRKLRQWNSNNELVNIWYTDTDYKSELIYTDVTYSALSRYALMDNSVILDLKYGKKYYINNFTWSSNEEYLLISNGTNISLINNDKIIHISNTKYIKKLLTVKDGKAFAVVFTNNTTNYYNYSGELINDYSGNNLWYNISTTKSYISSGILLNCNYPIYNTLFTSTDYSFAALSENGDYYIYNPLLDIYNYGIGFTNNMYYYSSPKNSLILSPNSKFILTTCNRAIGINNDIPIYLKQYFNSFTYSYIDNMLFTRDKNSLLFIDYDNEYNDLYRINIYDLNNKAVSVIITNNNNFYYGRTVCYDGMNIYIVSNISVYKYDLINKNLLKKTVLVNYNNNDIDSIGNMILSPFNNYILYEYGGSEDNYFGDLHLITTNGVSFKNRIGHNCYPNSYWFSPKQSYIATTGAGLFEYYWGHEVYLWNTNCIKIKEFKDDMFCFKGVSFSYDEKYVSAGCDDGSIRIWNIASGRWISFLPIKLENSRYGWVVYNERGEFDYSEEAVLNEFRVKLLDELHHPTEYLSILYKPDLAKDFFGI